MTDPLYDPIAAFVATLAANGVRDVVISPGSRSTPLALAFHAHPDLRSWIQLDERAAGFFALGQARRTGRPSVLVCTSGTAAANYLPAVVEANHAGVPMIVCTADRPPELRHWGAGQTIDQVGIFGTNVRWFADLPVPSDWTAPQAAMAAARAWQSATGPGRGPVHCNWPLREPLEPVAAVPVAPAQDVARVLEATLHLDGSEDLGRLAELVEYEQGLLVVGPDAAAGLDRQREVAAAVATFSHATGWPVIGEPISQVRAVGAEAVVVAHADHILKHREEVTLPVPDVVVRIGASPTTKPVRLWLEATRPANVVLIDPEQRWHDASFTTSVHVAAEPISVLTALAPTEPRGATDWTMQWQQLEAIAAGAVDTAVVASERSSAEVVRTLAAVMPRGATVMSSNSMSVRDLDAFVPAGVAAYPAVGWLGNRGASGIDGIVATASGIASQQSEPVAAFVGDLALLHDLNSLTAVARAGLHLTVLCVDNDGGAIFSMLPIAGRDGVDESVDFDTLFRTRHGIDLAELDGLGGIRVHSVGADDDLSALLASALNVTEPGVDLVLVQLDRDHDIAQRRAVTAAVGAALRAGSE